MSFLRWMTFLALVIMIPAGIVIGALIDRSIGNNKSVMIGPAVGKNKAGVVAAIRF